MYIPSQVLLGPLPLSGVMLIASATLSFILLEHLHAPSRDQDLLVAIIFGALLGEKGIYILTDVGYFIRHPSHLIFTPQSTLGFWGAAAGAVLAAGSVIFRHRHSWRWSDADMAALTLAPALSIWGLGIPWIGGPSHLWLFTITTHHLDHFATYFLWSLLMMLTTAFLWSLYWYRPRQDGQLGGTFLLMTAISMGVASLTTGTPGSPFTEVQWTAWLLAVTGYRLMTMTL